MVSVAKIVSFISLCLSVYIKVKTLIGTTKSKGNEDEADEADEDEPTPTATEKVPDES